MYRDLYPLDEHLLAYAEHELGMAHPYLELSRTWDELLGTVPAWLVSAWIDLQNEPLDAAEQLEADFLEAEEADTAERRFWMAA
jgi:hypothetical protein